MLAIALKIARDAERIVLRDPEMGEPMNLISRSAYMPFRFILVGGEEFLRPAFVWAFSVLGMIAIGVAVFGASGAQEMFSMNFLNMALIIPFIFVAFTMPSSYCSTRVRDDNVSSLMAAIKSYGIDSNDSLEVLESYIEKFSERVSSRINFYRWLIGGGWATYLFLTNLALRLKTGKGPYEEGAVGSLVVKQMTNELYMVLGFVLAASLVVLFYKKASDLLMRTIEFACLELKTEFIQAKDAANTPI